MREKDEKFKIKLSEPEHPVSKTLRILKRDIVNFKNRWFVINPKYSRFKGRSMSWTKDDDEDGFPQECDVVIIGGGAMGSSVAYWLKKYAGEGLKIVVVDKDFTVKKIKNSN